MHISPWYLRTQFVKLAWDLFTFSFLASFLLLLEKRWCRKSNFRGLNPFNQISFPFKNPFKFYFNFNSSFREKKSSCAWIDGTKWSSVKKIEHNFHFWNITICLFDFALWFERRTQPTILFFQLESYNWISCSCFNRKSIGFFTYFQLNKINYVSDTRCKVHRCWARAKKLRWFDSIAISTFFTYHTESSLSFQNEEPFQKKSNQFAKFRDICLTQNIKLKQPF